MASVVPLVTTAGWYAAPARSGWPKFREFSPKVNYFDETDEVWIQKYRAARNEEAARKSWFQRLAAALHASWGDDSGGPVAEAKNLALLELESPQEREELADGRAA